MRAASTDTKIVDASPLLPQQQSDHEDYPGVLALRDWHEAQREDAGTGEPAFRPAKWLDKPSGTITAITSV